ncbi:MAG TPA: PhoH family protein [Actinomycetota bacterium]
MSAHRSRARVRRPPTTVKVLVPGERDMVALLGTRDELLKLIEERFETHILVRGNEISITGEPGEAELVAHLFEELIQLLARGHVLTAEAVGRSIEMVKGGRARPSDILGDKVLATRTRSIRAKTIGQKRYLDAMRRDPVVFSIGPAGTGKTYLAVAAAVGALQDKLVQRIILTRPAVEAGERLGFLPGDIAAKVNPYLRPLYDALYEMLEPDAFARAMERGTIEVAPLAFMRGRTLNDSFIILDEAQNTSREQMKMFLTRLGFGSRAVITGDDTQIDLPPGTESGLVSVQKILAGIDGVSFCYLDAQDVVRHKIVQEIVEAYGRHAAAQATRAAEAARKAKEAQTVQTVQAAVQGQEAKAGEREAPTANAGERADE